MKKILAILAILVTVPMFANYDISIDVDNDYGTLLFYTNEDFENFLKYESHDYEIIEVISGERLDNDDYNLVIFKKK